MSTNGASVRAATLSFDELGARIGEIVGAANVGRGARELGIAADRAWVARPGAASEIAEIMRLSAQALAVVVPVGTASRRQGHGADQRLRVAIDTKRMANVLHLDETSLVVHAQAGLTGLALEELLLPRGLTIGDFPPAALRSTIGGLIAVRTPGKSSPRHGFFEDAVLGVSAVLADGRTIHTRVAPRRATGPDLARAMLGSEGTLGVITSAVLRIHRRPEARLLDAHRLPTIDAAIAAVLAALRKYARPAAVRIYDAAEAAAHLGDGHASGDEAILVVATAGPADLAAAERQIVADASKRAGGVPLGTPLAELWWRRRTGHAVVGPTPPPPALQITARGPRLAACYRAVRTAAAGAQRIARAHISRFDDDGACLFVTLLDGARPDPTGQARAAVEAAAHGAGGLLVGERDASLKPYFESIKASLDPGTVFTS
jgi:alkyldihydroxyacetonephosphate synthase